MLKKIIIFLIILININFTFADEIKPNGVLFYEQCNILLDKSDKKNIADLGENLCIFIENKNSEYTTILAKKENNFGLELINNKTLDYLKQNYYRGEKINIYFSGYKKNISQKLNFNKKIIKNYDSLVSDYKIKFFEDILLKNFEILKKSCNFNSFQAKCSNSKKQEITEKIIKLLNQNILNREKLLKSSKTKLISEKNKITKIKNKISFLDKYYTEKQKKSEKIIYSENIKFTINFLIYKFKIYNKILENRISDLNFTDFLKENKIYFVDKKLVGDLYITQNDQFTFFYYKNKRVNTLKNALSHFDDDELEQDKNLSEDNIEYLKEKIREKYSANFIENTDNQLVLITKKYLSKTKYLLFDTKNNKIFEFYGKINKLEKGKKGYYFLVENYKGEKYFLLHTGKVLYIIIEPSKEFNIYSFELLAGKKVKLFYSNSEKNINEKIIDIGEY